MSNGCTSGVGVAALVGKRRIASLLILVAWDVGLGSVGAVGDASGTMTSNPTASSYSHSSSVSGIVGRASGGGMDGVGVGGGGFRWAEQRGTEPPAALFAEVRGWI